MALSKDPKSRSRQLANRRDAPPAERGNKRAKKHGAYAEIDPLRLNKVERHLAKRLAESAPVRERGELPAADVLMVSLLAASVCRWQDLRAWLAKNGIHDRRGRLRPAVHLERRLSNEIRSYLAELGMTPKSRTAIGVDLVRTRDLAREMSGMDEPVDAEVVDDA